MEDKPELKTNEYWAMTFREAAGINPATLKKLEIDAIQAAEKYHGCNWAQLYVEGCRLLRVLITPQEGELSS